MSRKYGVFRKIQAKRPPALPRRTLQLVTVMQQKREPPEPPEPHIWNDAEKWNDATIWRDE